MENRIIVPLVDGRPEPLQINSINVVEFVLDRAEDDDIQESLNGTHAELGVQTQLLDVLRQIGDKKPSFLEELEGL